MIAIIVIIVLALLFYNYLLKPQLYWKSKNVKQGVPVPILGDNLRQTFQLESMTDMVLNSYNRYKDVRYSGVYQATIPTLLLHDIDLIKQITVKDFDHFVDHMDFILNDSDPLWSKNLFALKGDKWREMRATLSPTFTSSKMRLMFELMEKSAQQYVDFYHQQNKGMIELELKDSFTRVANDVIANCAFGVTVDSLKEPTNEFYLNGKEVTDFSGFWKGIKFTVMMLLPTLSKLLNFKMFAPSTEIFFKKLVRDSVRVREEKNIVRPDVINLLMEARKGKLDYEESKDQKDAGFATVEESDVGKSSNIRQIAMTEEDMAAQVLIFFFAGFDTISTMLSFMCYELAINTDIQEKLRKEIDSSIKSTNGQLSYEALNKMKYLDMVISESMRKHPPAPVIDRICTKPYTIQPVNSDETSLELKIGEVMWIPIIGIHRDEQFYPNPDKFDPERFSDENKDNIKPYTFLSFGSGPRNCIGSRFALMEVKTLIYHILSKFELVVTGKTPIPLKYDKVNFNPAIEGGCWVGFQRRKNINIA